MTLLLFLAAPTPAFFLALAAALLHEAGHLTAAALLRVPVDTVTLCPLGAEIRLVPALRSYQSELLLSLSGPLIGLLPALPLAFGIPLPVWVKGLGISALSLSLINLLPVRGLDGGDALSCLLSPRIGIEKTDAILSGLSFCALFLLWCAGTYSLLYGKGNPSLTALWMTLFTANFVTRRL